MTIKRSKEAEQTSLDESAPDRTKSNEEMRAEPSTETKTDERAERLENTKEGKRATEQSESTTNERAKTSKKTKSSKRTTAEAKPTSDTPPSDPPGPPPEPPSYKQTQWALRRYVENFYDIQEMRLACGGRTQNKAKAAEIVLHELDLVRLERQKKALEVAEKIALKDVEECLWRIPFYQDVLSDKQKYRGIGPTMAGVILSHFDFARQETVSQCWAFCGLRPMPAFRCNVCQSVCEPNKDETEFTHPKIDKIKCSTKGRQFLDRADVYESAQAQRAHKGEKLNFNKWLRTKMVGVLGSVILKMTTYRCRECQESMENIKDDKKRPTEFFRHHKKKDGEMECPLSTRQFTKADLFKDDAPFRKFYDNYKHRKEQAGWGVSDGHRHNAAIRYMIKMILLDIHTKWRNFHGLPVRVPYQEQYLGHKHHEAKDTHTSNVNQRINEIHTSGVNRRTDETQRGGVNQVSHENHNDQVNQLRNENQTDDVDQDHEFQQAVLDEEMALALR